MRGSRKPAAGFTLVELLVMIAIIGILIALMLPAIQAARESARRTSCINNLKQLAIALLNYHDIYKQFPLGSYSAVEADARAEEDGLGWATQILPQLEEQALYEKIQNNKVPGYEGNPWITSHTRSQPGIFRKAQEESLRPIAGGETILAMFICPSVDLPTHLPEAGYFDPLPGDENGVGYATAHYKGSRGYGDRGIFWPPKEGALEYIYFYDINGDGTQDAVPKKAMSRVRIEEVTDGTSKTIIVGEAAYFPRAASYPLWMGIHGDDGAVMFQTEDPINCNISGARSFPLSEFELEMLPTGIESDDCAFSWHSGGAYFAFVDGSVRFISEHVDLRSYWLMGDRADDEVIAELAN
jgi:prepilin-type processing-associated H-X9-DG protein